MKSGTPTVVYLLRNYPRLSQTFVRNEIFALRRSGVDVLVFSIDPGDTEVDDPGPFRSVPRPAARRALRDVAWWAVHHPVRLARHVYLTARFRDVRPRVALGGLLDVARELSGVEVAAVHTHFAWDSLATTVLLAKLVGAPSSATVHAHDIYVPAPRLTTWLAGLDKLVTVCQFNVRYLRDEALWARPVAVVPCGVEVPPLDEARPVVDGRVVCVARLVPKKGVVDLVEAMGEVRGSLPGASLVIIGDGPERAAVEHAVERLGLSDVVQLLGAVGHADVLAMVASAAVFVLACQVDETGDSDALPVALREAMASGVPVVTTAVAGIPELVTNDRGWIGPPGDSGRLAANLRAALSDPEECRRRASRARQHVLETATFEHTALQMRSVLEVAGRVDGTLQRETAS